MTRTKAWRQFQMEVHRDRRLKEDRNQHYRDLKCACWFDPRTIARFREQPKSCHGPCCQNVRRNGWLSQKDKLTFQERRFIQGSQEDYDTTKS